MMRDLASVPAAPGDQHWMVLALAEAEAAAQAGEVPVGAVVVHQGKLIATGRNSPIGSKDPTAHAEVNALRAAASAVGNYRLDECELFVTLEPCAMCAGAILHSRLARVVFGAPDPRTGVAGSVLNLFNEPALNHHTQVLGGVMSAQCGQPLQAFFQARRAQARGAAQPLRDDALRTPDARFEGLALSAELRYVSDLPTLAGLRMAWQDNEASLSAELRLASPVLCLHGPGQWGHLFRHLWPLVQQRRLLVPDLIGHGRSDKPKRAELHRPDWHAQVLGEWLQRLDVEPAAIVFHPRMDAVAQALAQRLRHSVAHMISVPHAWMGRCAEPIWPAAPFPDRGHMAAARAWGLRDIPQEDLPAHGAERLAELLKADVPSRHRSPSDPQ